LKSRIITLTALLIALCVIPAEAQVKKPYSLSGWVIDSLSGVPVEFASVALYKRADTLLITGTISDQKGRFEFKELGSAEYLIRFSFVGYQNKLVQTEIKNESIEITEPIRLRETGLKLEAVEISAQQIEKQMSIEKTRINVSRNIGSVTGNAVDILKSHPSVSIDADEKVYLRGNENILILLDGRPTTLNSLNSIPGSIIDNIEIITNPDAKYDSEGTGGIINIVTRKQSKKGLAGNFTLNAGYPNRLNGNMNLNYHKGIWDIGINLGGRFEKNQVNSSLTRRLLSQTSEIQQDIHSFQRSTTRNTGISISAKPTPKDLLVFGMRYVEPEVFSVQEISGKQVGESGMEQLYNRTNEVGWYRKLFEGSFSYQKIFEKEKNELSIDMMFSRNQGSRPANYFIDEVLAQKSDAGGAPTNITLQLDYLKKISKGGLAEMGIKGFSRFNNFTSRFYDWDAPLAEWTINELYSNDLEHKEQIISGYLMYSDSLFGKLYYKIGTRLEYSHSELVQESTNDDIRQNYWFPFPNLLLKYNLKPNSSLAFSITRRITRPTYPKLNPFMVVIDELTYETGNKNLQPETMDKAELNYSWIREKYQIRSNLYVSRAKSFISQVSVLSAADKLIVTYVNGERQLKSGLDLDVTYKISKSISLNSGLSAFHTTSSGSYGAVDLSTNDLAWTGNFKALVKASKKTEIQLVFNYNSPIALPQFNLAEIWYTDLAIKRTLLKDKLTASFTITDVFNTRKWIINSDNPIYLLHNESKGETRIFWLGLTYNFNSFKQAKSQKNENGEDDGGVIRLGQ
jgi:outer membrane receptor protein involved in Fe transport